MSAPTKDYPSFDLATFFGVASIDRCVLRSLPSPADIPWGHAINSREKLAACLKADIMLAVPRLNSTVTDRSRAFVSVAKEADICVSDSDPGRIVMSHPPVRESDVTFQEWIALILEHLKQHPNQKVGMKLDFKDPPAVQVCLRHLADLYAKGELNIPLWVNADILDASGRKPPFDPDVFLSQAVTILRNVVVSVGWTTVPDRPYTQAQIDEMLALCKKHNLKNATFPMRASLTRASEAPLRTLLAADPSYTLTIWTGKEHVSEDDHKWLKDSFDNDRLYMDLGGF